MLNEGCSPKFNIIGVLSKAWFGVSDTEIIPQQCTRDTLQSERQTSEYVTNVTSVKEARLCYNAQYCRHACMHAIALHCTTLICISQNFNALYLSINVMRCRVLQFTMLHCGCLSAPNFNTIQHCFTLHYTVNYTQSTIHSTQSTIHTTQSTIHSTQSTVHYSQYTVHYTQYTVNIPLYTVHSPLYTVQAFKGKNRFQTYFLDFQDLYQILGTFKLFLFLNNVQYILDLGFFFMEFLDLLGFLLLNFYYFFLIKKYIFVRLLKIF